MEAAARTGTVGLLLLVDWRVGLRYIEYPLGYLCLFFYSELVYDLLVSIINYNYSLVPDMILLAEQLVINQTYKITIIFLLGHS